MALGADNVNNRAAVASFGPRYRDVKKRTASQVPARSLTSAAADPE